MEDAAATAIERVLASARERLADVPRDALGALVPARRVLAIPRAARIVPAGSAWHLGVLLVADDALLGTGEILRARQEAIRGFAAQSQRDRAERAAAARRGGFAEGQTVHIGWERIDPAALTDRSAPVALRAGTAMVRWSAAGGYVPLTAYLEERIALLRDPPARA